MQQRGLPMNKFSQPAFQEVCVESVLFFQRPQMFGGVINASGVSSCIGTDVSRQRGEERDPLTTAFDIGLSNMGEGGD